MQSKTGSFTEAVANTLIGYFIGLASQWIVFPKFGMVLSLEANLWISLWFTIIGITRSYLVRRLFNKPYFRKLFDKQPANTH